MAGLAGIEIKAGIKKAAAWNNAKVVGANEGILLNPTTFKRHAQIDIDDSLGMFFTTDGTPGAVTVEGDMPAYLRYDGGVMQAIAFVMGNSPAPAQQGGTTAYAYSMYPETNTDGIFATLAMSMKDYVDEIPTLKLAGFTIKGSAGKPIEITFKGIGSNKVASRTLATTTTTAAIGTSDMTIPLTAVGALPSNSPFYLKIDNEVIKCSGRSGLNCTVETRGYGGTTAASHASGATVTGSEGANSIASMGNLTYFETSNRLRFSESVFRLRDWSSSTAIDDTNKIYPSSFEFSFQRKLVGVHTGQYLDITGSAKQELVDEPTNNEAPEISLKLEFPRHTTTTYLKDLGNDTRKMMDIVFTGANIAGAYNRQFKLYLPHLQYKSDDITDEKGIIKEPVEFIVHAPQAQAAGFEANAYPFYIKGVNRRSTSYLA